MRTKLIAALTVATATVIANPAKAYTTAESDFLSDVFNGATNAGYGIVISNTDPTALLSLAYTTCDALDSGASFSELTRVAADSAWQHASSDYERDAGAYILGHAIGSGVQYLCPRHYNGLQNYLNPGSTSATYYSPERTYQESSCRLRPDTNIRSGPSTSSSVIANESTLRHSAIEIHSSEMGDDGRYWSWIGFSGSDGRTAGWVRNDFILPCS